MKFSRVYVDFDSFRHAFMKFPVSVHSKNVALVFSEDVLLLEAEKTNTLETLGNDWITRRLRIAPGTCMYHFNDN